MSYNLTLYLKSAPTLSPNQFADAIASRGWSGELAPDFNPDGSISPLCAKLSGILPNDPRSYLAVVDYIVESDMPRQIFALPSPKGKKQPAPTLTVPEGGWRITFSCGMDHLELPFALLLSKLLAGTDGILYDPQCSCLAMGESDIETLLQNALQELQSTPTDRLLLHEFDEWI